MMGCPDDELFARLLDDRLNETEQARIVGHVEVCPRCQDYLEALTAADIVAQSDRRGGRAGGSTPAALLRSQVADHRESGLGFGPLAGRAVPRVPGLAGPAWPEVTDFEILEELGRGGMGVVYKARQRSLNRLVALKMIRAGTQARAMDLARFRIEAEAVARLRHANILQIFEIGEVGGLPFVALELLEGGSLEVRLAGTPQPGPFAAGVVATLARAVHAAHQAGIVHRDLKPSNILFTRDAIPKIADFGLAKRLEEEDGHTESGQVMGSPSYICPEQARGRNREVGPSADIYSLGAILYQMLTGRPPFRGTTPVETVMQVIHEEPVPPSRLQSKVPRDLETICLKCLSKEPHRRYPSADDLADDLDRYVAGEPIRARRTPVWERAIKWARRRPTLATLLAVGVVAATSLGGYVLQEVAREAAERRTLGTALIETDRAFARGNLDDARARVDKLMTRLEREPRLADLGAQAASLNERITRGLTARAARQAAAEKFRRFVMLRNDALVRDVHFTGLDLPDDPTVTRDSVRKALQVFAAEDDDGTWRSSALPASLSADERAEVAEGIYELVLVLAEAVSRPAAGEDARDQAHQALRILDGAAKVHPAASPALHLRRAACLARAGDTTEASRQRAEAERLEPAGAFDHFLLGREWYRRGAVARAQRHFEAALRIQPDYFWALCLSAIGELNSRPPRPEVAKAALRDCLERHPDFAWLYLLRGFACGQAGASTTDRALADSSLADAEADFRAALKLVDPKSDLRYAILVNRGLVRFQHKRLADAVDDFRAAIELQPKRYNAYVNLAWVARERGNGEDALDLLGRAIELRPDSAALYRMRALWKLEQLERPGALADLEQALRYTDPDEPEAARDQALRGHLLYLSGRYADALAACDAALLIDPREAEAHRWRVASLLELKRYDEVLRSCNGYLARSAPSAEILEVRGLARAHGKDYAGAIADYTQALALKPDRSPLYSHRGWAHLVSDAPRLALHDFEEAVRRDPASGDAYSGRGSARVLLGQYRQAVADAEEALRHGETTPRMLYNAARIYAQASSVAADHVGPQGARDGLGASFHYQDRALELLDQALGKTSTTQRAVFWRDVINADTALRTIRRRPRFAELAARFAAP